MIEDTYHTKPPRRWGGLALRMAAMLVLVLAVIGGIGYYKYGQFQQFKGMAAAMKDPLQTVSTTPAQYQDWQAHLQAVGSLRAVNGVDLAFETAGIIDAIHFSSGDDVQAGTVLLTLRPDEQTGKMQALQAQLQLAEITAERDQKQFKAQAVAQVTLDADTANLKNIRAQIAQVQAQLDEKVIRAPFSGHLGIRAVDLGQYVQAGTPIVTLQALDPIYVDFFLPQQALQQLKMKEPVSVKIDTYPGETFVGEISAVNPKIDPGSRNIQVRATIKNPQHRLLPGMYATAEISSGEAQRYLTLPQTAITFNPYGSTVFLAKESGKDDKGQPQYTAQQTFITTGATRGDQVAVIKGLAEGDTVVTTGQNKLHNGSRLTVNNTLQPASDAAPTPQDR